MTWELAADGDNNPPTPSPLSLPLSHSLSLGWGWTDALDTRSFHTNTLAGRLTGVVCLEQLERPVTANMTANVLHNIPSKNATYQGSVTSTHSRRLI